MFHSFSSSPSSAPPLLPLTIPDVSGVVSECASVDSCWECDLDLPHASPSLGCNVLPSRLDSDALEKGRLLISPTGFSASVRNVSGKGGQVSLVRPYPHLLVATGGYTRFSAMSGPRAADVETFHASTPLARSSGYSFHVFSAGGESFLGCPAPCSGDRLARVRRRRGEHRDYRGRIAGSPLWTDSVSYIDRGTRVRDQTCSVDGSLR